MYGTPTLQVLAKKLNLNMYQNWIEGNYIHWSNNLLTHSDLTLI